MDIENKIVDHLKIHGVSNARTIAKALDLEKTKVNSILYSKKNVIFKLHETQPPTWSIKSEEADPIKPSVSKIRITKTSEPIHIDFQGGDWKIVIQIQDMSRNDPVVSFERSGPNSGIIKVSSNVVSDEELNSPNFPDVVLALASSALAWEIAIQSDAVMEERFEFDSALKDIYLSLGAHDIRSNDSTVG